MTEHMGVVRTEDVAAEEDLDPTTSEVAARMLLSRVSEPGDARIVTRVARQGAPALVRDLLAGGGAGSALERYRARLGTDRTLAAAKAAVAHDHARLMSIDGRLVIPGTPQWPTQLDDLGDRRPLLLWARGGGDLRLSASRSVAVVGSRACTAYGEAMASELAVGLTERGWCVVSGAAFGVDAAAHRGALAAEGCSVGILACGVDVPYPVAHDRLLMRLLERGVVLSESPPGEKPHRGRFLVRNRLIAALTRGTVVVEAGLRSGSLATMREAEGLGRVVMGVPGPATNAMSAGVHRALRAGALLVSSVDEVVEAVGDLGTDLAPSRRGAQQPHDHLDPTAMRVLDAVPSRGATTHAAIAVDAGVDEQVALATLGLLELEGFVRRDPGGWRLAGGARSCATNGAGGSTGAPG